MSIDPISDVLELPVAERLRAMQAIWDSLASRPDQVPVTAAQRTEVERALREYHESPHEVIHWEEAQRRLRSRD